VRITNRHPEEQPVVPLIRELLARLVEDPVHEGLVRTPERASAALRLLTSGYRTDIPKLVNGALSEVKHDGMVVVRDIGFVSLCEHHLLPFFGRMHIAYLPDKNVIGSRMLPRIVNALARRLQIQERLTQEVAQTIHQIVRPLGVSVICEAKHFCMMMRGAEKQNSVAITRVTRGAFRNSKATGDEFLSLVPSSRGAVWRL
jgi:GTP cyclohydrolase I